MATGAPSAAAPVQTGYSEEVYDNLAGAANYLGTTPEYLQQFGVASIHFFLALNGNLGRFQYDYSGEIVAFGPRNVYSDYSGPTLTDINVVMQHYNVNPSQAQFLGGYLMTYLAQLDARNKGLNFDGYRPSRTTTTTTTAAPTTTAPTTTTTIFDPSIPARLAGVSASVMLVGDSITQGSVVAAEWAPPGTTWASYRNALYSTLWARGFGNRFDFVGGRTFLYGGTTTGGYPDPQHEGYGGYTVDGLQAVIPASVGIHQPDVVVIHAGTNDLTNQLWQTPEAIWGELQTLVAQIRSQKPNVVVVLATVIPQTLGSTFNSRYTTLNSLIRNNALGLSTPTSRVYLVDQAAGYNTAWLVDGLHPNPTGDTAMANKWADLLTQILPTG